MKRLYRYLPPLAGDYSGVCSALYELGGMLCIHDASGCTGNYTGFDEPRSYGSSSLVYCTALRRNDAVMGNEEVYIQKIIRAAEEMKPRFIGLVGSPVPLVIGFDFNGVAREIEARTGIPTFGFATSGMQGCYKDGVAMALNKLLDYYVPADMNKEKCEAQKDSNRNREGRCVNIVGATPLDISEENLAAFQELLYERGYEVVCTLAMGETLENIPNCVGADVNLAISQAGLITAMNMYEKYNIPYLAGLPIGEKGCEHYFRCLDMVFEEGKNLEVSMVPVDVDEEHMKDVDGVAEERRAVILEDGILASSIKVELLAQGYTRVDIVSLFGKDRGVSTIDMEFPDGEREILQAVNRADYQLVVADPILLQCRQDKSDVTLLEMPKYSVSSKLMHKRRWTYIGDAWNRKLEQAENILLNV